MESLFENDALIAFLSAMCSLFALHLVLKRDQITRAQQERVAKDIQSLLQLKLELEGNMELCAQLAKKAGTDTTVCFQTKIWRKYCGNFPLFYEELDRAERCYESFKEWNDRLRGAGKADTVVIKNVDREVESVLRVINDALNDLP